MIGLLAAFKSEVSGVIRDVSPQRVLRQVDRVFFVGASKGEEVVVGVGGMGAARASEAAAELIRQFQPDLLISTGTCGAISNDLDTGHIVAPHSSQVLSMSQDDPLPKPPVSIPLTIQEPLAVARARAGLRGENGLLLTADRLLKTVAEKKALADIPGAVAVDMESAAIAEAARAADIPFGIARAVLDRAWDEIVVDYERMTRGRGEPAISDVLGYLLTHPGQWSAFGRDVRRASRAAAALRVYFRAYFEQRPLYA